MQASTPGPTLSSALTRRAGLGPHWGNSHAPWVPEERPRPKHDSLVWDPIAGAWSDADEPALEQLADLASLGPVPGVAPGARARHGNGSHVPWHLLDRQLAGVNQRRGRGGAGWIWDSERSALAVMDNVVAQTARASTVGWSDIRMPSWLRADYWGLTKNEQLLLAALITVFENGWGGLYDCQAAIAADLLGVSEKTVRNMLNGQRWTTKKGVEKQRPGLVERGFVVAIQTYRPGSREGRPSDMHWLLLRIGPTILGPAVVAGLAKGWTGRARRGSGWKRSRARRRVSALRWHAHIARTRATGGAWQARRPKLEQLDGQALEQTPPPSGASPAAPALGGEGSTPAIVSGSSSSSTWRSSSPRPRPGFPPATPTPRPPGFPPAPPDLPRRTETSGPALARHASPLVSSDEVARVEALLERTAAERASAARDKRKALDALAAMAKSGRLRFADNCPEGPADNPTPEGGPLGPPSLRGVGGQGGALPPRPDGSPPTVDGRERPPWSSLADPERPSPSARPRGPVSSPPSQREGPTSPPGQRRANVRDWPTRGGEDEGLLEQATTVHGEAYARALAELLATRKRSD